MQFPVNPITFYFQVCRNVGVGGKLRKNESLFVTSLRYNIKFTITTSPESTTTGHHQSLPLQDIIRLYYYRTSSDSTTTGHHQTLPLQDITRVSHYRTSSESTTTGHHQSLPLQNITRVYHYRTSLESTTTGHH